MVTGHWPPKRRGDQGAAWALFAPFATNALLPLITLGARCVSGVKRLLPYARAKRASIAALVGAFIVLCSDSAFAQCAMCRAAVEGSENAAKMARGLNLGILVMLIPPVTIFCSIFIAAFKYRNREAAGGDADSDHDERA
jgi:hypothetical protein